MKIAIIAVAFGVTLQVAPTLAQHQQEPSLPHQPTPPPVAPYRAPARPPVYFAPGQMSPSPPSPPSVGTPSITISHPPPSAARPPVYFAPGQTSPSPPSPPSVGTPSITISHPPRDHSLADLPGFRHVPSVASLPAMRNRPIVRHVVVSGVSFDVPAIAIVGAPYVIDVPGFGWIYVPEEEYPSLFAMLTSDDPVQVEAAYARLQDFAPDQPKN